MSASAATSPINENNWKLRKRISEYSADYVPDVENTSDNVEDDIANPSTKRCKTEGNNADFNSPMIIRKTRLLQLSNEKLGERILSPITEISLNLSDTTLGTPITGAKKRKSSELNESDGNNNGEDTAKSAEGEVQPPEDQVHGPPKSDDTKLGEHQSTPKSGVVSNNFDLNAFNRNRTNVLGGGGHGAGRRLLMENNSNIIHTAANMAIDELSFYDDDNDLHSTHNLNSSPTMNALLMDDDRLLSPEGSPQRFHIIQSSASKYQHQQQQQHHQNHLHHNHQTHRKLQEPSPRIKKPSNSIMKAITPAKPFQIFHSLSSGSMESTMDDEYMELFEMESLDDDDVDGNAPSNLNSLISGHIKTTKTSPDLMKRPPVRRCLSLTENQCSMNRARTSLFEPKTPEILRTVQDRISSINSINSINQQSPALNTTPYSSRIATERCFKRPEPPSTTVSPIQTKRYKGELFSSADKENNEQALIQLPPIQRPILRKHVSMNDADIMSALSRSSSQPDLIGDFSKPFCLPLMDGRHRDLKSISCLTMAKLINGSYKDSVASYKIIDCRYPYEFEGGHIRDAKNLYTQEQIMEEFVNCKTDAATVEADGPKRHILVFHCEFSSERGPKLSRFLRNHDRARNTNSYPALHYPEIYLLHGGYKEFYEQHPELCDPVAYRPMLEPSYAEAYKHFRAKSKSWNGDVKGLGGATSRLKKSRSRLVL